MLIRNPGWTVSPRVSRQSGSSIDAASGDRQPDSGTSAYEKVVAGIEESHQVLQRANWPQHYLWVVSCRGGRKPSHPSVKKRAAGEANHKFREVAYGCLPGCPGWGKPLKKQDEYRSRAEWIADIQRRLGDAQLRPLSFSLQALERHPADSGVLSLVALAALVEGRPDICLRYVKRLKKWYLIDGVPRIWEAVAYAQQGKWSLARTILEKEHVEPEDSSYFFPPGLRVLGRRWLTQICRWRPTVTSAPRQPSQEPRGRKRQAAAAGRRPAGPNGNGQPAARPAGVESVRPSLPPLPSGPARIPMTLSLPPPESYRLGDTPSGLSDYLLRADLDRLALLQGFDDLLCLPHLRGVDHYWFQAETVRKVLKHFRGRVLLADEVGLGKTIEAGMVIKEYVLRGMVEHILILTPASLVGQWREEMEAKFDLSFRTSHDPLLKKDPSRFWLQPRIIASIAAARRSPHRELVGRRRFDLVLVDEAHHLKNRSSRNWKLVDTLQKRFLLLLSATPVQNSLTELYNLLTLLKPGIFRTEKEFRSLYMCPGNPRVPANRERLHGLMREVMIRNTRALVDVRLPARQALTSVVEPSEEERACYADLSRLVRALSRHPDRRRGLSLHHLLVAAGSSPAAAQAALRRFDAGQSGEMHELCRRYAAIGPGAKVEALLDLLERNPSEKKMVFVRFRETLEQLVRLFTLRRFNFVTFEGRMSGPDKDAAIERFRTEAQILLCTESGGEGRNVQFCNTLVNFDLPWNPQAIEQRIGRIHRIGQTREVFVFNLATRHTVEEEILRILDEKINMFQLVVGEVQAILGEMGDERDFAGLVYSAWLEESEEGRKSAFGRLGDRMVEATRRYERASTLDEQLFGEEFEA